MPELHSDQLSYTAAETDPTSALEALSPDIAHLKQSAIKRGATPVMASVMRGKSRYGSPLSGRPLRP